MFKFLFKILCKLGLHRYKDQVKPFDLSWWNENVGNSQKYEANNIKRNEVNIIIYEQCIHCGRIGKCVKCNINIFK
jgi:hypothetical protein